MFDFMKYRFIALVLSVSAIVFFVGIFFYKGGFDGGLTYSVEFTGGTQVLFKFEKPINSKHLLSAVKKDWSGAVAREFSDTQVLIRVPAHEGDTRGLADRIKEKTVNAFPDNPVTIESTEIVGPGVGKDLRWKSTRAVLLVLLLLLLYIAARFWSIAFASGADLALIHDAIMILGFLMLFGREISISVIGAILVVLGYSINDSIVIFSRMRENLKKMSGASLYEVVNTSLNQTFKRTLLTSISTFLAVGSMFVFGGEVLRNLSLVILLGIFFGTYSSIYVVSPMFMALHREKKK